MGGDGGVWEGRLADGPLSAAPQSLLELRAPGTTAPLLPGCVTLR